MTKKKKTKQKRIEIRVSDVPSELHEIITKNAKLSRRTLGNELLTNYKP
jgi:uncharacterized protein (DUF1778 family)